MALKREDASAIQPHYCSSVIFALIFHLVFLFLKCLKWLTKLVLYKCEVWQLLCSLKISTELTKKILALQWNTYFTGVSSWYQHVLGLSGRPWSNVIITEPELRSITPSSVSLLLFFTIASSIQLQNRSCSKTKNLGEIIMLVFTWILNTYLFT